MNRRTAQRRTRTMPRPRRGFSDRPATSGLPAAEQALIDELVEGCLRDLVGVPESALPELAFRLARARLEQGDLGEGLRVGGAHGLPAGGPA